MGCLPNNKLKIEPVIQYCEEFHLPKFCQRRFSSSLTYAEQIHNILTRSIEYLISPISIHTTKIIFGTRNCPNVKCKFKITTSMTSHHLLSAWVKMINLTLTRKYCQDFRVVVNMDFTII